MTLNSCDETSVANPAFSVKVGDCTSASESYESLRTRLVHDESGVVDSASRAPRVHILLCGFGLTIGR